MRVCVHVHACVCVCVCVCVIERERKRNSCQRILIFEPRIRDGCRDEYYFCQAVFTSVCACMCVCVCVCVCVQTCVCVSLCVGKKMESSNLTAWQKLVCVRTRKKEMEGGNGCRREEEEVAWCEPSECLERQVIFFGGGGKVEFHITAEQIYPTGGTGVAPWSPVGGWINYTYAQKQCIRHFLAWKLENVFKKPQ